MLSTKSVESYWKKVIVEEGDTCWQWSAYCNEDGYGRMRVGDTFVGAHRVSWEIHFGPIPEGLFICHHCDNPPCSNPAHLFLGTGSDNTQDSISKGRWKGGGVVPLSSQDLARIKELRAAGYTLVNLAERYNTSFARIHRLTTK